MPDQPNPSDDIPIKWGLDHVKAMPDDWTDEQRLAAMVSLYDDLLAAIRHPAPG